MTPETRQLSHRRAPCWLRAATLAIVLPLTSALPLRAVELPVPPVAPVVARPFSAPARRAATVQTGYFVPRFEIEAPALPAPAPSAAALLPLAVPAAVSAPMLRLLNDFPGIGFDNVNPPNPSIAAGPSHLLAITNGTVMVLSKAGAASVHTSLSAFFQAVATPTDFITDPRTLFDSGRFFVSVVSRRNTPFAAFFLLAVSATSDPTGAWTYYALNAATDNTTPTTNFADLPSLGVDNYSIYLTANMFDNATLSFQGAKIRLVPKAALLAGAAASFFDFSDLSSGGMRVFHLQAAQSLGSSPAGFIVNTRFPSACGLTVWRVINPPGSLPVLNQADVPVGGPVPDTAERRAAGHRAAHRDRWPATASTRCGATTRCGPPSPSGTIGVAAWCRPCGSSNSRRVAFRPCRSCRTSFRAATACTRTIPWWPPMRRATPSSGSTPPAAPSTRRSTTPAS